MCTDCAIQMHVVTTVRPNRPSDCRGTTPGGCSCWSIPELTGGAGGGAVTAGALSAEDDGGGGHVAGPYTAAVPARSPAVPGSSPPSGTGASGPTGAAVGASVVTAVGTSAGVVAAVAAVAGDADPPPGAVADVCGLPASHGVRRMGGPKRGERGSAGGPLRTPGVWFTVLAPTGRPPFALGGIPPCVMCARVHVLKMLKCGLIIVSTRI